MKKKLFIYTKGEGVECAKSIKIVFQITVGEKDFDDGDYPVIFRTGMLPKKEDFGHSIPIVSELEGEHQLVIRMRVNNKRLELFFPEIHFSELAPEENTYLKQKLDLVYSVYVLEDLISIVLGGVEIQAIKFNAIKNPSLLLRVDFDEKIILSLMNMDTVVPSGNDTLTKKLQDPSLNGIALFRGEMVQIFNPEEGS